jgi:hypothetical protein
MQLVERDHPGRAVLRLEQVLYLWAETWHVVQKPANQRKDHTSIRWRRCFGCRREGVSRAYPTREGHDGKAWAQLLWTVPIAGQSSGRKERWYAQTRSESVSFSNKVENTTQSADKELKNESIIQPGGFFTSGSIIQPEATSTVKGVTHIEYGGIKQVSA